MSRTLSAKGAALIAGHEGKVNTLYDDPAGHCTIGIGHLVHRGNCNGSEPAEFRRGLSDQEVYDLFIADAGRFIDAVNSLVTVPLSQNQFDALVSFAFNVGIGALEGSTLRQKLNRGDYAGAAQEFGKWVKADGRTLPGLVRRRGDEARLFLTPDDQEAPVARIIQEHLLADAHPELERRFRAGCQRFGGDVRVNSVLRDTALQQQFSDCHQAKKRTGKCPPGCERSNCAPANAPGTSNHEPHGAAQKSLAIDAEPTGSWSGFQAALRAEGLVFPIPSEDWHIQCRETPSPSYEPDSESRLPAATAPSKEDQLFSKSPVHTVHIIASHSGLLLTSSGEHHGAGVIQRRADGSLNQRWEVWGHDDHTISLVNRAGGFALDRPDYSTEAGTFLQVARTEHNAAQRWSRDSFKPPLARLWTPGTNRCMDVHMRSTEEGAGVQLWYGLRDEDDPRHQQFILAPTV